MKFLLSSRSFWINLFGKLIHASTAITPYDAYWEAVKLEAALPGVRLHDLRHSFASHAAARSENRRHISACHRITIAPARLLRQGKSFSLYCDHFLLDSAED